jgi:hypothetical protein
MPLKVQVAVTVEAGADDGERDELTGKLRRELRRLDVDAVDRPHGQTPDGTRAIDMAQIGELLVTLATTATALGSLVAAVRSWLTAHGGGTVKLTIGGDSLEITGALSEEQRRLVDAWIKAHASSPAGP